MLPPRPSSITHSLPPPVALVLFFDKVQRCAISRLRRDNDAGIVQGVFLADEINGIIKDSIDEAIVSSQFNHDKVSPAFADQDNDAPLPGPDKIG